jgi:hypothetical protein
VVQHAPSRQHTPRAEASWQVLGDEPLRTQYYAECAAMAERIGAMRKTLRTELEAAGSTHDWSHVTDQIGMFAFTGMDAGMCDELTATHHIFLTRDGRISVAGLNADNVAYVAKAIRASLPAPPASFTRCTARLSSRTRCVCVCRVRCVQPMWQRCSRRSARGSCAAIALVADEVTDGKTLGAA